MQGGQFEVTIGQFSGPLDLLLTLIEERKMLISDISLAKVADDFIQFVKAQENFPAGQTAHFILVAATLLLIKSRSLLPVLTLSDEEEESIEELEKRLNLYKIFRNAARDIAQIKTRLFFGGLQKDVDPVFAPAPDMTLESLHAAILGTLDRVPKKEERREVAIKTVVSLDEMMTRLTERIERALSMTFKDFVGSPEDKREIVVGFLAVLELVKRGTVLVEQEQHFTDITIAFHGSLPPPRYH